MTEPVISIIVPVYNVAKYISKCLDSIISQSFRHFELILVDDGSTDASGKICDDWASFDERIIVVHKDNGGVSTARNLGILKANTGYITFIDSDDYVDPDYLMHFVPFISDSCDFVINSFFIKNYSDGDEQIIGRPFYNDSDNGDVLLKYLFDNQLTLCSSVNKLYSKERIVGNRLFFDELISNGEDKIFVSNYLLLLDNLDDVRINNVKDYHYLVRDNSATSIVPDPLQWGRMTTIWAEVLVSINKKFKIGDPALIISEETIIKTDLIDSLFWLWKSSKYSYYARYREHSRLTSIIKAINTPSKHNKKVDIIIMYLPTYISAIVVFLLARLS